MTKSIVIAERDNIAAIMEDGKVSEFIIHRGDILLNDIYLAKVDNILPSIEAAFVDVGSTRMGFLHTEDIIGKGALKDKLKPKQNLVVQVVKEPTGHKGPRVTTSISIPGRFLVLIPYEAGINVSKKISATKERARLKSIVSLIKPVGVGVIVRTEAEGQSEADIQEDLELLLEKWNNIITASETVEAPNLLYRDQDLLYKVIRESATEDVDEIIVDTTFALHRVQNLIQNWHLSKNMKVSVYKGSEPLLVASGIYKEIKSALQTKINLASGAYLYIQPTEALTVIDVNSGKFTSSATQEETILKTNIEAVHEIARQLRLRNVGGMVIIDFIDMLSRANKLAVMEELEIALEPDKAKPQVGQLSDLGLVELTRHRQGQTLEEIFTKKCPHCQGNGYIMEELQFSSSVAEGEYRSKAAKLKLPTHQFKKPEKGNKTFQNQRNMNPSLGAQTQQNNAPKEVENNEINLEKINEFVSENSKIEVANAVIDYDSVDKFENQQPKVEEKDDLRKNLVTPVVDELKVAETTENTEVSEKSDFAPATKGRKYNGKNQKVRGSRKNTRFNKTKAQENIEQPLEQNETPAPVEEQTSVVETQPVEIKPEPVVEVVAETPVEAAPAVKKPKGKTRRATTTRARSKKKAAEQANENAEGKVE